MVNDRLTFVRIDLRADADVSLAGRVREEMTKPFSRADHPTRERSSRSPRGSPAIESESIGNVEGFRWNSFRRTDRDGE